MHTLWCYMNEKKYCWSNIILKRLDWTKFTGFCIAKLLSALIIYKCALQITKGCSVQHFLNTFFILEISFVSSSRENSVFHKILLKTHNWANGIKFDFQENYWEVRMDQWESWNINFLLVQQAVGSAQCGSRGSYFHVAI